MIRALGFIIVAALALALAWWIGNLPGDVTAHAGKYTVQTSVPAALLLLFLIALLFVLLLRLLGGLRRAPGGFGRWRGGRRKKLGDIATQRGIVALAAGDATAARAEAGRARKLLGEEPLVLLLTAESAQLSGDDAQARAAFEKLTADKHMAFLGHRGLLRHRLAAGDHDAAHTHATAAEAAYPGSAWLKTKRLDIAVKQGNWKTALGLASEKNQVATFATAAAMASADPPSAVAYGRQAVKADPAFAPGVVAYAQALLAAGRARAAKRALATGWKTAPHPQIAQAWLAPVASPIERAQAAASLAAARPGHGESELLLAQTSLEAELTGEARRHAEAALAAGATDGRAAAVLATLDGHTPPAQPGPRWVCAVCHARHDSWSPACPQCGSAASLAWQTPSTALALI